VNYNGEKYLDALFNSLINIETKLKYEIIFVDNNSSDCSTSYIEQNYRNKKIKIIKSEENLGFSRGNNLGVSYAEGEFIIFLNNDTRVSSKWLDALYKNIRKFNVGIVTSKLVFFYEFIKISIKTNDKIIINPTIEINQHSYKLDPKFCKNLLYQEDSIMCFGHSYFYIPILYSTEKYSMKFTVLSDTKDKESYLTICNKSIALSTGRNIIELNRSIIQENTITLIQNVGSALNHKFESY